MNDTAALRREVEILKTKVMALENELRTIHRTYDERLDWIEKWMYKQVNRDQS